MDPVVDDVESFADVLADEDEITEEKDLTVEDPEEETTEEGEETEEESDEESIKDDESKVKGKTEIPQFKEVTKKYPNLFKDFPHLRHTFFHAQEYQKLFPSVEEAKEAVGEIENLREIESALSSGTAEGLVKFMDSLKGLGDEVVPNFAVNFLPSIKKSNQDLFYQIITPELVNFTRSLYEQGIRNSNDNMKNSALVAALHFFGDAKVASGEKEVKLPSITKKTEDSGLDKDRKAFRAEQYSSFYNDVVTQGDSKLSAAILSGIDKTNKMTDGQKELVVEKVMKEVTKTLASDTIHSKRMDSLWKKAGADNFNSTHKAKIIAAYIGAANEIMPKIRAKVRATVLGIRERSPETEQTERGKRVEPKSTTGGGRQSGNGNGNGKDNGKQIDWSKTSDRDYIAGKITYK